jgi:hypothetical protein
VDPGTAGGTAAGGETAVPAAGQISLLSMKFAPKIDRTTRNPSEERSTFTSADTRVYCWMLLANKGLEESAIVLEWKHGEKSVSSIELRVGPKTSTWRTWAYMNLNKNLPGKWEAVIRDKGGNLIGSGEFAVE